MAPRPSQQTSPDTLRQAPLGAVVQFQESPIPSFLWRREGSDFRLLAFNGAADDFTRHKLDRFIGMKALDMYPDQPEVPEDLLRCWSQGVSLKRQMSYLMRSTQETKEILATYVPLRPSLVLVHVEDLTERHQTQLRLRESEDRFQALVEGVPLPFLIARISDGLILYTNPLLRRTAGMVELVGRRINESYVGARDRQALVAQLSQQGYLRNVELQVRRPDGQSVWIHLCANSIRYEAQDCVLCTLVDMTQQKAMEQAMTALAQTVGQSQELLQSFMDQLAAALQVRCALIAERTPAGRLRVRACGGLLNSEAIPEHLEGPFWDQAPSGFYFQNQGVQDRFVDDPLLGALQAKSAGLLVLRDTQGDRIGLLGIIHDALCKEGGWNEQILSVFAMRAAAELMREKVERDLKRAQAKVAEFAERQQNLSGRLLRSQETERRRIAHELHDEIGQALTAVQLNLTALLGALPDAERDRRLTESMSIVDRALEQAHDISLDLRPSMLDDLGLASALKWYTDRFAERTGLELTSDVEDVGQGFDPALETACFRVAQEALTNVSRHAQASAVTVRLRRTPHQLELRIRDDGVGLETAPEGERSGRKPGLGLLGMEEHVSLVGGRLQIHGEPGKGTCIEAHFFLGATRPSQDP